MSRRVRVDDRSTAALALVAGAVASTSGASPTGAPVIDAIVTCLAVSFVTWASAAALWWALALGAGAVTALAADWWSAAAGALALVGALWIGSERRSLPLARAAVAGVVLNVACRLELDVFTGAPTLVGVGVAALLTITGLSRRSSRIRRRVIIGAVSVAGFVAIAIAGLALAALGARNDISDARGQFVDAANQLSDGDYELASTTFTSAGSTFDNAARAMSRPWAWPSQVVPILAQHRTAVADVSAAAADASTELSVVADVIDVDALTPSDGRFDLDALRSVQVPLVEAHESMTELRATVDDVDSPWLIGPVTTRLDDAAAEYDERADDVELAVEAATLAPHFLGDDGPRRYLIALTTPAEARGQGGFTGNYAVLTADDGELAMSDFGRIGELNAASAGLELDLPDDWSSMWGRFGFTNADGGRTGNASWSNVTLSPHFPSTAQVMRELFTGAGRDDIDGVIALDPYVLETLVGFTGPIDADPDLDMPRLSGSNTAQFLLFDQYSVGETDERIDLLEDVATIAFDRLLDGNLPGPTVIADRLGDDVDESRLVAWMSDPVEQELIDDVGLSGALPEPVESDGFQVIVNNAAANKLDAYLDRFISYRASFDPINGTVIGTIDVELTNNGPTEGFPSGVIGNYTDDPDGTNRSYLTVYTAFPIVGVGNADGRVQYEAGTEAGLYAATTYVIMPPGSTTTISFDVAGQIVPTDGQPAEYQLVVGTQPLVAPAIYDIRITDPATTDEVLSYNGPLIGQHRFVPS